MTVLERIINRAIPKSAQGRYARWTKEQEEKFKRELADVSTAGRKPMKVKCRIETNSGRYVLCIRPDNIAQFKERLKVVGLDNCEAAQDAVARLEIDPLETIRFEIVR